MYCHLYEGNIEQAEVCQFLRHLLRHLRGHVIALLDNGPVHKGSPIQDLGDRFPRLHIEFFPPYAPELNPDEGVWNHVKREVSNGRPDDRDELMEELIREIQKLTGSQALLRGCIHQSDLPPFLP